MRIVLSPSFSVQGTATSALTSQFEFIAVNRNGRRITLNTNLLLSALRPRTHNQRHHESNSGFGGRPIAEASSMTVIVIIISVQ